MANLVAGVQRIGFYFGSVPFSCNGSVFATGTTKISTFNTAGNPIAWRNGTTFNNLSGTARDQLLPNTSFIVNPTSAIVTDDTKFSFGTAVPTSGGNGNNTGNAFSSGFGA